MTAKESWSHLDDDPSPEAASRQQALYWSQLVRVKVSAEYIQLYRDDIGRQIWWFDVVKSGDLKWRYCGMGGRQDASFGLGLDYRPRAGCRRVKGTLPLAKRYDGACQLSMSLDAMFIDVQFEWEAIASGRLTEEDISSARKRMMTWSMISRQSIFPMDCDDGRIC